jgi:hypothetical protein
LAHFPALDFEMAVITEVQTLSEKAVCLVKKVPTFILQNGKVRAFALADPGGGSLSRARAARDSGQATVQVAGSVGCAPLATLRVLCGGWVCGGCWRNVSRYWLLAHVALTPRTCITVRLASERKAAANGTWLGFGM